MIAHILGAMLGTWLVAAIIAYPVRKLFGLNDTVSYAVGFLLAAPIASIMYSYGSERAGLGLFDMLPLYGLGALLGFVAVAGLFKLPSRKRP